VRRDLLRRPDDRLGPARVHAPQDEAEQLPHVAAALVRAGWGCLIAWPEGGNRLVDHAVLSAGKNC